MYGHRYNTKIELPGYDGVDTRDVTFRKENIAVFLNSIDAYQKRAEYVLKQNIAPYEIKTVNGLSYFISEDIKKLPRAPKNPMMMPDMGNPDGSALYSVAQLQIIRLFKTELWNIVNPYGGSRGNPNINDDLMHEILYDIHGMTESQNGSYGLLENVGDFSHIHPVFSFENLDEAIAIQENVPGITERMESISVATVGQLKKFVQEHQTHIYPDDLNDDFIKWNIRAECRIRKSVPNFDDLEYLGKMYYRQGEVMAASPSFPGTPRSRYDSFLLKSLQDEFEMTAYMIQYDDFDREKFMVPAGDTGKRVPDFIGKFRNNVKRSMFAEIFENIVSPIHPKDKALVYPVI